MNTPEHDDLTPLLCWAAQKLEDLGELRPTENFPLYKWWHKRKKLDAMRRKEEEASLKDRDHAFDLYRNKPVASLTQEDLTLLRRFDLLPRAGRWTL